MQTLASTRAFTLIEISIALALIGILALIAVPTYRGIQERARRVQVIEDMHSLDVAVRLFQREFHAYPGSLDAALGESLVDPWGAPYQYLVIDGAPPSVMGQVRKDKSLVPINSTFDLYSKGPDADSKPPLSAPVSQDDIIRANDGAFFGLASDY